MRLVRIAPALGALALLVWSAIASLTPATGAVPCSLIVQQSGVSETTLVYNGRGITQPIASFANVVACSLTSLPCQDGGGTLRVLAWDPVAGAPDPTTVALRTAGFGTSCSEYNSMVKMTLDPPLVALSLDHVAEPMRRSLALDFWDPFYTQAFAADANASPDIPPTLGYTSNGVRTLFGGAHTVISHAICGGDGSVQDLRVLQSVMTTNLSLGVGVQGVIQRFRVPSMAKVQWAEFAMGSLYSSPGDTPDRVAIYDADGQSTPPTPLPAPLGQGLLPTSGAPVWFAALPLDNPVTLEPDHDYWLYAGVNHTDGLLTRNWTGGESADFQSAIGPTFTRTDSLLPWTNIVAALCFRLIGTSPATTAAPSAAYAPLAVRLAPNPTHDFAWLTWRGARGAVRVTVFDARGRRVRDVMPDDGGEGGTWRVQGADATPLPAGVYFVRVRDGAGQATRRLVVVR
ncbi:MAG TPA: T9SS type A sorting domain-containing protein [Gemmatimonadales bacterium]|nr:T9SS type A sorting domain-containing protein [Gemmatimonadales bacterium]